VEILAMHRDNASLEYSFNGVRRSSNKIKLSSQKDKSSISVVVYGSDGTNVELEPIDLLWNAPPVHPMPEATGDYRNGQKGAIVEFLCG
jgi:hypothetical protein